MSQDLYERYKAALRRGHLAGIRGRPDEALAAYEEAASLAPDRALPHASLGAVLRRLGRAEAADAAFTAALHRAAHDEAALLGRAELRAASGRRIEAALDFEALAGVLERAGRIVDACDAARRALELAESRGRRASVERLVGLLRDQEADPATAEALRRAMRLLEPLPRSDGGTPPDASLAGGTSVAAGDGGPGEAPADRATAGSASTDAVTLGEPSGRPEEPEEPSTPAEDEPDVDAAALLVQAERQLDAGDGPAAREALLSLAAHHRIAGRLDAALDACLQIVAVDPGDAAVQLEIAAIQLARGWADVAAEKVRLLARIAELDAAAGDAAAVATFAARHGLVPERDEKPAESEARAAD